MSISDWDFGWQDVYRVAAPYWLPAGTRIATEYVFDNSAANPRNPESPPARALWGFRSADEMGDVWLQVMTRTAADRQVLVRHFGRKAMQEDVVGLEMQLAVNPDNAPLHDDAALLYLELGDADAAARHFAASARLRPAAAARFNLGTALEAGNRLGEAEAAYRAAFDIDPEYAPAHVNLGTIRLNQGRVSDALAHYREAIRLAPGNADARNNLGRLLAAQGDTAGARASRGSGAAPAGSRRRALQPGRGAARRRRSCARGAPLPRDHPPPPRMERWLRGAGVGAQRSSDSGVRRPDEAVRLARRAVELSSGSDAALYDAFALASTAKSPQLAAIQQRLSLYRAGRPYREMAPAPIR